ncbi:hypothetical protein SESBI_44842 [Sesbania bispinosa]|nr:hypothetical protein SESBI_44842 [Sesbania bispinosa]
MTKKKGRSREGKLSRYMKAVMRLLSKARDLYVHSMSECSGHFAYMDTTMGFHIRFGFMNRDEIRKRRFNEAIVNMLYPSPPQVEQELEPVEASIEGSGSDAISGTLDDNENASTSSDEEHGSETEKKLSRAQRKNIRKKKLKEEAIRRGKLIGPLLPLTPIPAVRPNASEEGDELDRANSKKMKHRRMAKRLAKEKQVASASELEN